MANSSSGPGATKAILTAGFVAGTLDITAAMTQFYIKTGKDPVIVLKYVASGVLGKTAMTGGLVEAICGLLFHYLIAFIFTLFFFWIYPKIKIMAANKWITGIVYGLFVWVVMNRVVVPLSRVTQPPFKLSAAIQAALILVFMIGLPITLIIGKYYTSIKDRN